MTVWLVILKGRQFGVTVDVYDNPVSALEHGRGAMKAELERWKMERPDELRAAVDFFKHPEPYYARTEDGLEVRVVKYLVKT